MKNTDYAQEFENGAIAQQRARLSAVLAQCTEAQINLFNRMYGSIDEIPQDKMSWAYSQIMKALEKGKG